MNAKKGAVQRRTSTQSHGESHVQSLCGRGIGHQEGGDEDSSNIAGISKGGAARRWSWVCASDVGREEEAHGANVFSVAGKQLGNK